jgi:glycosyltransferase involved in cell wall biosynthesis
MSSAPPTGPEPQRLGIVVPSTAVHDSRTARIARSLATRGHDVTVHARADADMPAGETTADGYRVMRVAGPAPRRLPLPLRVVDRAMTSRRQAAAAARADRGADLYHGMGLMAIPVALHLAARAGAPAVYDVRDLYVDARNLARLPAPARRLLLARERAWARRSGALVTVNPALADVLEERFGLPRPAIVMNCAPRWEPDGEWPRRFHEALGLPTDARIALYHGGLEPDRGIEQLLAAVPALPVATHVVLLGYGSLRPSLETVIAGDAGLRGRVHMLDAVTPAELPGWIASADVAVVPIQPTTLNHRLSTPNKLFEALAAGVPVVASDFPAMRAIVLDDPLGPLGSVCDPTHPVALAAAIRGLLERDEASRAADRRRCLDAAHARYAWETQLESLLDVYSRLTGRPW